MKKELSIEDIPKVELHCHLDGSVPKESLKQLAIKNNFNEEFIEKVTAPSKCKNLKEYLNSFDIILPLLQTQENLTKATYDTIASIFKDNVVYLELRFAPMLHLQNGLTIEEVINAVVDGLKLAIKDYPIYVNLLICAMRNHTNQENIKLVNKINEINSEYIVSFDFAGNEVEGANENIGKVTSKILNNNYQLTIHSGECNCPKNVYDAIKLGAKRIGHGVAVRKDNTLMDYCVEKDILLELAPTSNIQTNAIESIEQYPLRKFLNKSIPCSINTDNRTVSNTNLNKEYKLMIEHCNLTLQEVIEMNLKAVTHSFANAELKEKIKTLILKVQ